MCKALRTCQICNGIKSKLHVCLNQKFCGNCKKGVNYDHKCCILTEDEKTKKKLDDVLNGYIFFDYEAYQVDGVHVANLVIAEKVCNDCINNLECQRHCGVHIFYDNCSFCDWVFDKQNQNFTAVAHNLQGYDGMFIMRYIKESMLSIDHMPNIIMNGTKLLTISFRNVKFIDSYAFIPIALEKFTKTFDLKELKKGFFPHLFNKPENQNYIGVIPEKFYFGSDYFSVAKKEEFEKWYETSKNSLYDFKNEIISYCMSDVKLLKEGCLAFRSIIINITNGIDPFAKCITIASLCHYIYRKILMKPNTISVIPVLGYNPEQKTSAKALQWIKFQSFKHNLKISHAKNGGELKIGQFLLDGYCEASQTVYEFHGCFWHGCKKCYKSETWNPVKRELMGTTYRKHTDRINF